MTSASMAWLSKCGLYFDDNSEEQSFFEAFALSGRQLVQFVLLGGGILFYAFFLWDQVIDFGKIQQQRK